MSKWVGRLSNKGPPPTLPHPSSGLSRRAERERASSPQVVDGETGVYFGSAEAPGQGFLKSIMLEHY